MDPDDISAEVTLAGVQVEKWVNAENKMHHVTLTFSVTLTLNLSYGIFRLLQCLIKGENTQHELVTIFDIL